MIRICPINHKNDNNPFVLKHFQHYLLGYVMRERSNVYRLLLSHLPYQHSKSCFQISTVKAPYKTKDPREDGVGIA